MDPDDEDAALAHQQQQEQQQNRSIPLKGIGSCEVRKP